MHALQIKPCMPPEQPCTPPPKQPCMPSPSLEQNDKLVLKYYLAPNLVAGGNKVLQTSVDKFVEYIFRRTTLKGGEKRRKQYNILTYCK